MIGNDNRGKKSRAQNIFEHQFPAYSVNHLVTCPITNDHDDISSLAEPKLLVNVSNPSTIAL